MHTSSSIHRPWYTRAAAAVSVVCLLTLAGYTTWGTETLLSGERPHEGADNAAHASASDAEEPVNRLREGTVIDGELGRFVIRGDRLFFHPNNSELQFVGLENLILERISRQLDNQFEELDWSVSGRVTEYRGSNYLLVTRATQRIRTRDDKQ